MKVTIHAGIPESPSLNLFTERLGGKPYCSNDLSCGLLIRQKSAAAQHRYIQPNTPTTLSWFVFDVDHEDAVVRWNDVNLPAPTIIAANPHNGRAHVMYALEKPVFMAAEHQHPMRYAAAIQDGFRLKLNADPGYAGLVTKNPLHDHWRVFVHPGAVYDLGYLAEWVDLGKTEKRRQEAESGLGRNCTIFDELRTWAYRWVLTYKETTGFRQWQAVVFDQASKLNQSPVPLHVSEVQAIAKSVAKWTWKHFSKSAFSEIQSNRAKGAAAKKRSKTEEKIRTAIESFRSSGLKVTKASIADAIGMHRNALAPYGHLFKRGCTVSHIR